MKEFHGHASARFDLAPRQVFDLIIDVDRFPEWNGAIEAVLERPPVLEESTQWVVKMHPPPYAVMGERLPSPGGRSSQPALCL